MQTQMTTAELFQLLGESQAELLILRRRGAERDSEIARLKGIIERLELEIVSASQQGITAEVNGQE